MRQFYASSTDVYLTPYNVRVWSNTKQRGFECVMHLPLYSFRKTAEALLHKSGFTSDYRVTAMRSQPLDERH